MFFCNLVFFGVVQKMARFSAFIKRTTRKFGEASVRPITFLNLIFLKLQNDSGNFYPLTFASLPPYNLSTQRLHLCLTTFSEPPPARTHPGLIWDLAAGFVGSCGGGDCK